MMIKFLTEMTRTQVKLGEKINAQIYWCTRIILFYVRIKRIGCQNSVYKKKRKLKDRRTEIWRVPNCAPELQSGLDPWHSWSWALWSWITLPRVHVIDRNSNGADSISRHQTSQINLQLLPRSKCSLSYFVSHHERSLSICEGLGTAASEDEW